MHGWPNYQCSCHYLRIIGNDLCVVTRTPLTADPNPEDHALFKDYIPEHPSQHPNRDPRGVGIFLNPIGPAAHLDSPRNMEPVTDNRNIQYMILINHLMVDEFNQLHKQRADHAMLLGKPVRGGGKDNERSTMYPYHDLPSISLRRAT